MKILRISLRNLASLKGNHTVDFTAEPLRTAGLFSITGPTGAGKSTLLDALCLALYEKTPRLDAVRGAVKLQDGSEQISQKDCANLLTRGTFEGFAEVVFVGVDAITYTARWSVRRAYKKASGALQNTEMTLFRGNVRSGADGVVEQGGRKTEVLPAIAAKVGLSYDQFTRAVLLAQNDFATFLKADDKERAEILQALTGTGKFEDISRAVWARHSIEQNAVEKIVARIEGIAPLSPEARSQAEAIFQQEESTLKDLTIQVASREQHSLWFQHLAALTGDLKRQEAELESALQRQRDGEGRRRELEQAIEVSRDAGPLLADVRRAGKELDEADKARNEAAKAGTKALEDLESAANALGTATKQLAEARKELDTAKPELNRARVLDAQLGPLRKQLERADADLNAANTARTKAVGQRDKLSTQRLNLNQELVQVQTRWELLASHASLALDAVAWFDRLDRAEVTQRNLGAARSRLIEVQKSEQKRRATWELEQARESAFKDSANLAESALRAAEAELSKFDAEQMAARRTEIEASRESLIELQTQLRQVAELSVRENGLKQEVGELEERLKNDLALLSELQSTTIPNAEIVVNSARQAFDLAQATVGETAVHLRQKLVPSEACPVCGSKEHPFAGHSPSLENEMLRALRKDLSAKEDNLKLLNKKDAELRTHCQHHEKEKATKLTSIAEIQTKLEIARAFQPEHPEARRILELAESDRNAALVKILESKESALKSCKEAEALRRNAEKQRDAQRLAFDKAAENLLKLQRAINALHNELTLLEAERKAAQDQERNAQDNFQKGEDELAPLFKSLPGSKVKWSENPKAFRLEFETAVTSYLTLQKQHDALVLELRQCEAGLIPAEEVVKRAQEEQDTKAQVALTCRESFQAVEKERASIFGGRSADELEKNLNELAAVSVKRLEECQLQQGRAANARAAAAQALESTTTRHEEMKSRHIQAEQALENWLAQFSQRSGRLLDRAGLDRMIALEPSWFEQEHAHLKSLDHDVQSANGALKVHRESRDAHLQKRPTEEEELVVADALARLKTELAEVGQRRDQANGVLMSDDQRRRDSAELTAERDARKLLARPWEMLNELIGSADGAKFRSIAQRRTLDILLGYANAQLDQLSSRYRLERLPESLNLIVCDRDMADERRSVHSLSGGECFLLSLALALGLASLTSNRLRVESLFIDEGFGSLDSDTLNIAMSVLMRLEAQGRKVGVISHVTEMAEAIPVQIRVVKGHSGTSRILVPGQKAEESTPAEATSGEVGANRPSSVNTAEIAAQILAILQREAAVGVGRVSISALRKEVGCSPDAFATARASLEGRVIGEGKSLKLV